MAALAGGPGRRARWPRARAGAGAGGGVSAGVRGSWAVYEAVPVSARGTASGAGTGTAEVAGADCQAPYGRGAGGARGATGWVGGVAGCSAEGGSAARWPGRSYGPYRSDWPPCRCRPASWAGRYGWGLGVGWGGGRWKLPVSDMETAADTDA